MDFRDLHLQFLDVGGVERNFRRELRVQHREVVESGVQFSGSAADLEFHFDRLVQLLAIDVRELVGDRHPVSCSRFGIAGDEEVIAVPSHLHVFERRLDGEQARFEGLEIELIVEHEMELPPGFGLLAPFGPSPGQL